MVVRHVMLMALASAVIILGTAPSHSRVAPDAAAGATETALRIGPRPGYCALDPADRALNTGFEAGVPRATVLVAIYAPCSDVARARRGDALWLPEWLAYETNTLEIDEDARQSGFATVRQLCSDAQTGHPAPLAAGFEAMVAAGHEQLDRSSRSVIYFGVVAEDFGACFLGSLKRETAPSGTEARVLTVTAFMIVGSRWVYQSLRRLSATPAAADDMLVAARAAARSFLLENE